MAIAAPPRGLCMAPIGPTWAVYSPLSGETMLLNDECAAIIEVLTEQASDLASVCRELAADVGVDAIELEKTIGASWTQLIEAGLIVETAETPS